MGTDRKLVKAACLGVMLAGLPGAALACEPVIPMLELYAGTWLAASSLVILVGVVTVKAVAFALFEKRISFTEAFFSMLLANVFSSIIGLVLAGAASDPTSFMVTLPIIYLLSVVPARRLIKYGPWGYFRRWNPWLLALVVLFLYFISFVLFGISQSILDGLDSPLSYWAFKFLYIYVGLIISFGLTSIWEEWVIARVAGKKGADQSFLLPVFKANCIAFLLIMAYPAIKMFPERLQSGNFLS